MKNICNNCGSLDSLKKKSEGTDKGSDFFVILIFSIILGVFFFPAGLLLFVAGVIFLAFAKPRRRFSVCTSCNAENSFIATDTPKGKQLFNQYHADSENQVETTNQPEKKQTWHGLW